MNARTKAALFDADGTLLDSKDAFRLMILDLMKEFGVPKLREESFMGLLGRTDPEIADAILPRDWRDRVNAIKRFVDTANRRWKDLYFPQHVKVFPGSREALLALRDGGFCIGVVSNGTSDELPLYVKAAGVEDLVEVIVSVDEVKRPKPAPDGLLEACRRMSIKPERTLYVGDTVADILAARGAGSISVSVLTGVGKPDELIEAQPDFIIDSLSRFPEILGEVDSVINDR